MNVLNIFGRRSRNNVKALLVHPVKGQFCGQGNEGEVILKERYLLTRFFYRM
jgi:hypothetical protein